MGSGRRTIALRKLGGEKSGNIPLEHKLKLRYKYRDFLGGERAYLGRGAMAHAWFHGNDQVLPGDPSFQVLAE